MNVKYKVGDRVRIISRLTKKRNEYQCMFLGDMDKYLGKIMTIASIDEFDWCKMKEDSRGWHFSEDMIECLADENFDEESKEFVNFNKLSRVDGLYIINW